MFLELCSDQQLSFFTLLDRTWDLFFIIITPISSNLVEKLYILWVIFYLLSFLGFAINLSSCLETLDIGQITKMTVHKKCLIKLKVFNQILWSWCYYNRRLPARRDLFWEDYACSSSRKKVTCIEMIITPKIMAYFWQFSFCIHKDKYIQVFIWKRLQSQFSLIREK